MSKLYITYSDEMSDDIFDEVGEGTVFADGNGDIITCIHVNDGNWRQEYHNPILKYFGISVEKPDDLMKNVIENKFKHYMGIE